MEGLEERGYALIPGAAESVRESLGACVKGRVVDYCALEPIVLRPYKAAIDAATGWDVSIRKWRFSNDTNKTDAGYIHRDNKFYGEVKPIYTVLTYIDGGTMEVVPGSHEDSRRSIPDTLRAYTTRVSVRVAPGDPVSYTHLTLPTKRIV